MVKVFQKKKTKMVNILINSYSKSYSVKFLISLFYRINL